ncbi:odorant receptor 131-2-like [Xiphophorus hellerii]|uniref:odorant receptor 131-2-like n=1 Tax=Xiphophorus hellerii TaxID=8084 RepID=UPI0013B41046|nr:odorant receptor 131-2-like [Xiphophorus hellerii]
MLTNQTQRNNTVELQREGLLGVVLFSVVTTLPCSVFLFINLTALYTLRSKDVFRETARYVLLFNLLLADTLQMAKSQSLFLLSLSRVTLLYPVCATALAFYSLPHRISSITLVIMCLERYIAVCYPLRHNAIVTTRNTTLVIWVVWTFTSLNVMIQIIIMFKFLLEEHQHMQMADFCGKGDMLTDPGSDLYDKVSTCFLFVLGGVTVIFCYTGIIVAARSAATDKESASKAKRTLLLHLLQMGLTVLSTIHNSLITPISKNLDRVLTVRLQIFLYVSVTILPKCLNCLIYGLRDQTIRPILILNLSCQWRGSVSFPVITNKKTPRVHVT